MIIRAADRHELGRQLRDANTQGRSISRIDLSALGRIIEHVPEDMTVTVEAGITLAALQQQLAAKRQWVPVDPPGPESLTIAELIARNISGPRRLGFGTVRDHLIGIEVALADGRLVRSGGKVVKNVAGFDVMKLFVGGRDSLGVIVEATFRLLPLPEAELFLRRSCHSATEAGKVIDAVLESALTPSVLDLHNVGAEDGRLEMVLGFSGSREEVDWQQALASGLGFNTPATLEYERAFWSHAESPPCRVSVLPSRVTEVVSALGPTPFVARAGNGVVYHRGPASPVVSGGSVQLARRLKDTFDPNGVLPPMPAT